MLDKQASANTGPIESSEREHPDILAQTEKYMASHFDDLLIGRFSILDIKPLSLDEINAYEAIIKAFPNMPVFYGLSGKLSEARTGLEKSAVDVVISEEQPSV
jgi:hypothetical protein